ncbi:hypothetical protein CHUAL_005811 [Chamberlinius hualienensis]
MSDSSANALVNSVVKECKSVDELCDQRMGKEVDMKKSELLFDLKNLMNEVSTTFKEIDQQLIDKRKLLAEMDEKCKLIDKKMEKLDS